MSAPEMQRRHFEFIASTIRELGVVMSTIPREFVAKSFATRLEDTNPAFDRERFLTACGFPQQGGYDI